MSDLYEIKCAACDVPLQKAADTNEGFCPKCGLRDTNENIDREVGDYAKARIGEAMRRSLREAVRGSKMMKVVEQPRLPKTHRFKVDLSL
jgi:uncharacterized Zn finger protein (UPF0148 family)